MPIKDCKGRILYEYEHELDLDTIIFYAFSIEYTVWAGEPMVMYDRDGGGYPGSPPGCEFFILKCLQIDDNKDLTDKEGKEAVDWFRELTEADNRLRERIDDYCFEDAADQYYD